MPSSEMIINQISSISKNDQYLDKKEINELEKVLLENENIENFIRITSKNKKGILLATDIRLIFISKGFVKSKFEEILYNNIDSIAFSVCGKYGIIYISTEGNTLEFNHASEDEVNQFVADLKTKITETRNVKIKEQTNKFQKEADAKYFGGHFKYPLKSGGIFDTGGSTKTGVFGKLTLYDNKIVFEKQSVSKSNKWSITIPFDQVDFESVGYHEKDSGNATAIGGGMTGFDSIGIGGGLISKTGNMNLVVLPYIDENGIKQAPKFQIKGFVKDKTEEWAQILYEKIVEMKKRESKNKLSVNTNSNNDFAIKIKNLKSMYENGLLSDEEFESKKQSLLDQI
jgi:hypothetical protein